VKYESCISYNNATSSILPNNELNLIPTIVPEGVITVNANEFQSETVNGLKTISSMPSVLNPVSVAVRASKRPFAHTAAIDVRFTVPIEKVVFGYGVAFEDRLLNRKRITRDGGPNLIGASSILSMIIRRSWRDQFGEELDTSFNFSELSIVSWLDSLGHPTIDRDSERA